MKICIIISFERALFIKKCFQGSKSICSEFLTESAEVHGEEGESAVAIAQFEVEDVFDRGDVVVHVVDLELQVWQSVHLKMHK